MAIRAIAKRHKDTRTQGHKNIRTTTSTNTNTNTTTREDEAAAFCGVDGAQKYRYRWRRGRWSNGGGWGGHLKRAGEMTTSPN